MSDKHKPCPRCAAAMDYRLGEYQCPQCEYSEAAAPATPSTTAPGARAPAPEPWRQRTDTAASADAGIFPTGVGQQRLGAYDPPSPKYDPAPTLNKEKLIFFGVFVLRALLSIAVAGAAPAGAEGGSSAGPGGRVMWELVSLGLLAAVLFIPLAPLKWGCATYSCAVGVLGLLGTLFGALLLPVLGLLAPSAAGMGGGFLGFLGLTAGLLQGMVYLWFASILYRDMQRIQAD